jgi:hypothetical protein
VSLTTATTYVPQGELPGACASARSAVFQWHGLPERWQNGYGFVYVNGLKQGLYPWTDLWVRNDQGVIAPAISNPDARRRPVTTSYRYAGQPVRARRQPHDGHLVAMTLRDARTGYPALEQPSRRITKSASRGTTRAS